MILIDNSIKTQGCAQIVLFFSSDHRLGHVGCLKNLTSLYVWYGWSQALQSWYGLQYWPT